MEDPVANVALARNEALLRKDPSFPVAIKQIAAKIAGVHTEFIFAIFTDRLLIVITQYKKLGTVFKGSKEMGSTGDFYDVQTLLGKREGGATNLYARQITEFVSASSPLPIVLSLSLRSEELSHEALEQLLHVIHTQKNW